MSDFSFCEMAKPPTAKGPVFLHSTLGLSLMIWKHIEWGADGYWRSALASWPARRQWCSSEVLRNPAHWLQQWPWKCHCVGVSTAQLSGFLPDPCSYRHFLVTLLLPRALSQPWFSFFSCWFCWDYSHIEYYTSVSCSIANRFPFCDSPFSFPCLLCCFLWKSKSSLIWCILIVKYLFYGLCFLNLFKKSFPVLMSMLLLSSFMTFLPIAL